MKSLFETSYHPLLPMANPRRGDGSGAENSAAGAAGADPSWRQRAAAQCLDRRKRTANAVIAVAALALLFIIYMLLNSSSPGLVLLSPSPARGGGDDASAPLPSSSTLPLRELHYAVVVDAGSSGSRAYLYRWPEHSGDPHDLLEISPVPDPADPEGRPLVKKAVPGVSSLADRPGDALEYISPLLEFAMLHIPSRKHRETPLYILATAGMRLLEKGKQEAIIHNLRRGINDKFPFLFPDGNLEVISGKQEGIYQWLSINYVLGKFSHQHDPDRLVSLRDKEKKESVSSDEAGDNLVLRPRTVGALDMGGASMQLAAEITSAMQMEGMTDGEKSQTVEINLGCRQHDTEHTYRVFVTTFLGYGANEAMARHRRDLVLQQVEDKKGKLSGLSSSEPVDDPCLPSGRSENVTATFDLGPTSAEAVEAKYGKGALGGETAIFLKGTGDWDKCYDSLKPFTRKREKFSACDEVEAAKQQSSTSASTTKPLHCPDSGMRRPPIQYEGAATELYGFSEFWYSMEDVLRMGGPYLFKDFEKAAKTFCGTPWSTTWRRFTSGQLPRADRERVETQCFKSAWLAAALHEGLGVPREFPGLSSAPNTVHGKVVHWTLGALLYRTRFLPLSWLPNISLFPFCLPIPPKNLPHVALESPPTCPNNLSFHLGPNSPPPPVRALPLPPILSYFPFLGGLFREAPGEKKEKEEKPPRRRRRRKTEEL